MEGVFPRSVSSARWLKSRLIPQSEGVVIAATAQFSHKAGDKGANLDTIRRFCREASEQGVEIIAFPEMRITGYWHVRNLDREQIENLSERVPEGPSTSALLALSREYQMIIGAGLIERGEDGRLYNTYVVALPDGVTKRHRKLHCFISEHMSSGSNFTVLETHLGLKVGVLICYDSNLIENARVTALLGADILLAPHFIVFSNGIGIDDDEVRTGNAMVLDPYGRIIAEAWKASDDMVVADLDSDLLELSSGSRWMRGRRPELYQKIGEASGNELAAREARFS